MRLAQQPVRGHEAQPPPVRGLEVTLRMRQAEALGGVTEQRRRGAAARRRHDDPERSHCQQPGRGQTECRRLAASTIGGQHRRLSGGCRDHRVDRAALVVSEAAVSVRSGDRCAVAFGSVNAW
jgi:hypothetical protein